MSLGQKLKFALGVALALWPVVIAAFSPAELLASLNISLLSSNRLPLVVFCVAALLSEALAVFLFFPTRSKPGDGFTSLSVVAAAAAGVCSIAFLAAAIANAMKIW